MTEQIARPLPFAGEAEKFVLGAILSGVKGSESCFDVLRAEDFLLDSHRKVFGAAQKLRGDGKQPDLLGVHDRLATTGELEAVGGIAYIAGLGDGLPRVSPVGQWAQLIRDKARLREGVKLAANLQEKEPNG